MEKGVASQHEPDGMVGLQIEIFRKRRPSRKPLPVPSAECVFVGLQVENREPVGAMAQEGSQESLSLGDSTHDYPRSLLKELMENRTI